MTLSLCLGQQWCLLYSPAQPINSLIPGQTTQQTIDWVNHCLMTQGPEISQWRWGDQNQAAKLVRINWIYQRLDHEPIRKPLVIDQHRRVLCGDTRLASVGLGTSVVTLAVLMSVPSEHRNNFADWQTVANEQELISVCGFKPGAQVLFRVGDQGLDWLEIGDATTAHHLHDQDLRVKMLHRYLQTQPPQFRFDLDWCRSCIDWQLFV